MTRSFQVGVVLGVLGYLIVGGALAIAKQPAIYPTALLPIQEKGKEVKDLGSKLADLLFARLAASERLLLVDREDLDKVLKEQELGASGIVEAGSAAKLGQLTGARLLISGSVLQVGKTLVLTAKVIGVETSRVAGVTVQGKTDGDLADLVDRWGAAIDEAIGAKAGDLVPAPPANEDRIAALKKKIGDVAALPLVSVKISERHVGQATLDPAAETEISLLCQQVGFPLVDARSGKPADIVITGEGLSESALRHGNLVSVKSRVEIKAVDRKTDKVLFVDRQTVVAVDLSEQIAAKTALQQAAAAIAERLLPTLAKPAKVDEK